MERIEYSEEKMKLIRKKVQKMISTVAELEQAFPGRHFTLDGHLVGSVGEVLAAYYYGIELYKASNPLHDGIVDGRKVQIKITQRDSIVINGEPEYLIVLYLTKSGDVFEVYNGRGKEPWVSASKEENHNNRHILVNKLMQLDESVPPEDRIHKVKPIGKMKGSYKNTKARQTNVDSGMNISKAYVEELAARTCRWWNASLMQNKRFLEALSKKQTINPWQKKGAHDTAPIERYYLIMSIHQALDNLHRLAEERREHCEAITEILEDIYSITSWDEINNLRNMNEHIEYVLGKGNKQKEFGTSFLVGEERRLTTAAWTHIDENGVIWLGNVNASALLMKMEKHHEDIRRITKQVYCECTEIPLNIFESITEQ